MGIILKSEEQIETMRRSGRAASKLLQSIGEGVAPGVSTWDLDQISRKTIEELGGESSFLNYQPSSHPPYPATICSSVNDEVVHGVPSKRRILKDGDVVGIDVAIKISGYHGDNAFTFPVGKVKPVAKRLLDVTRASLFKGIEQAVVGNRVGDIGYAVQSFVEEEGFSVVRELCGHGIGREMWEEPQVPNYGKPGRGARLKPGMVIAIEPMVCEKGHRVEVLDDGWTTSTQDGGLAAHFEHTIVILSDGPELLTANPDLWDAAGI
jgi:methionyl aminopeptidase